MTTLSDDKIRLRAYEIWDQEGRPDGQEWDHWLRAQRELGLAPADSAESEETETPDDALQGDITRLSAGTATRRGQTAH